MSGRERGVEKWGDQVPHPACLALGMCTGKNSSHITWLWKLAGLYSRRARTLWEAKSPLWEGWHAVSISLRHRSSSLKSICVTCEGELLTNFGSCARGVGVSRSFLQGRMGWWVPFIMPSLSPAGWKLAEASSDILHHHASTACPLGVPLWTPPVPPKPYPLPGNQP